MSPLHVFAVAKGHIDERLQKDVANMARGEKVEGNYLTYYLTQAGLPMKTVYSNVTELLLAGVDTVRTLNPLSILLKHLNVQPAGNIQLTRNIEIFR